MYGNQPTLKDFDEVLSRLAADARTSEHSPEWIRNSIVAGDEKVRILRFILEHTAAEGPAPRVLDVGAQIGAMAIYAAKLGCRTAAVDYGFYTRVYAAIAAEQGVDYQECDVGSHPLPFDDDSFDFVTYMDTIEHHSFSPKRVLQEISRVLAPGGRILLTTPNHASIYNRIFLFAGKSVNDQFSNFFESDGNSIYHGHHREYVRRELRAALEATGFQVEECRAIEEDLYSLLYFIRKSPRGELFRQRRPLLVRTLGKIWAPLHLPFGRMLWAVGRKTSAKH
ncbi:MAG: class I SAM-dependent methyltransferase [Candidatus Acidiferrales bacterium]